MCKQQAVDICASFVLESKHLEFKGKKDSGGKRSLLCLTERFAQGSGVLDARRLISVQRCAALPMECLLLSQCELGKNRHLFDNK